MKYKAKWRILGLGDKPVEAGGTVELDPESQTAKQLLAYGAIEIANADAPPVEIPEETTQSQLPPEVLAMSKAQLQAYALETYGLALSNGQTKEQMLAAISAASAV